MIAADKRLFRRVDFAVAAKLWRVPWFYVLLLAGVAATGYVALYSAGGSPEPYAARHLLRFGIGLIVMLTVAMIDIGFIARLSWPLYAASVGLLVLVARMGHVGKGAQRWLELPGIQLQPSELAKIALVLALASWFSRGSWRRMGNPLFLIVPVAAVAIPVGLILKEPNLGTAAICGMLGFAMFFAAGVRWWKVALVLLPIPFAANYAYAHLHAYQKARIDTFLNPESDPLGAGYNIIQSKIALGAGGMWGKGFLQGTQTHLDFLPEKQTDFIFTTIGEEFGFVGGVAVLGLLALTVLCGMGIALRCRNRFGALAAFGISFNLFLYVAVNIAMVMGAIPVGGVPLPLISHGGSAMLTVMFGCGVLMSAYVHRDKVRAVEAE